MAHFYGQVQGGSGEATRTGHKSSGLRARAASYSVGVSTQLEYDDALDMDRAYIVIDDGNGFSGSKSIHIELSEYDLQAWLRGDKDTISIGGSIR